MSQADAAPADWYEDPSGRFEYRYWDGSTWTGHVSTGGNTDWDPPGEEGGSGGSVAAQAGERSAAQDADDSAFAPQGQTPSDAASSSPAEPAGAAEGGELPTRGASSQTVTFSPAEIAPADPGPTDAPPVDLGTTDPPSDAGPVAGGPADAVAAGPPAHDEPAAATPQGGTIEDGEPSDTNLVANQRAGLDDDVRAWVDEVAAQVEPRLSRISSEWTRQPQAEAARACAYGLLVGHLAHLHPHMRPELSQVAEAHPSFTTLEDGARLDTLEQIARDPRRTAAWLGPLIGVDDEDAVQQLFD